MAPITISIRLHLSKEEELRSLKEARVNGVFVRKTSLATTLRTMTLDVNILSDFARRRHYT